MNIRMIIVNAELKMMRFFKSKAFLAVLGILLFALFINVFTSNTERDVVENFNQDNTEQLKIAKKKVEDEYKVTIAEVNRNSKLVTCFFDELIFQKKYVISGITEDYENVDDYDMQIMDIRKSETGYDVLVQICLRDSKSNERVYVPFKRYLINVLSSSGGLKVDYLSIVE